jgi:hypothetical protein
MATKTITNQEDLRSAFWAAHPHLTRKGNQRQNSYPTDTRVAFVEYVDQMCRSGQISDALARRATL